MTTISYTSARQNFKTTMDQVCNDRSPVIITRGNNKPVVMMSLEDYNAIEETLYLLKSPNNTKRLKKAIEEVANNNYYEKKLK